MRDAGREACLISDERLAEALAIERWKGAAAFVYIAERIGELVAAGDMAGVERFQAITIKLDALHLGVVH